MKKAIGLMLLLFFSAMLVPVMVQAQDELPGEAIELTVSNSLNETRIDEPVTVITMENLTAAGLPVDANPDSFRVTNATDSLVPFQIDNLASYGYEEYVVFPATVPGGSNATYRFYYSTEPDWSPPNYTEAVPIAETETEYTFSTDTYSGRINKSNGELDFLRTANSGNLLCPPGFYDGKYTIPNRREGGFSSSNLLGTAWEYGYFQAGIDDANTTLLKQGPVRSIIIVEGDLWYSPGYEGQPKDPSGFKFTTIYILYKDRVEALTHQVHAGAQIKQLAQVRAGICLSRHWLWGADGGATVTLDVPPEPLTKNVNEEGSYGPPYSDWAGSIFTLRAERDSEDWDPDIYGKFVDVTSANGTFGLGFIIYDSVEMDRIEVGDYMAEDIPADVIEVQLMQFEVQGSGPVIPGFEGWYHWAVLPHDDVDYTYTQSEAEKAYYPLGFSAEIAELRPSLPVWVIYAVFFTAAAALLIVYARKIKT